MKKYIIHILLLFLCATAVFSQSGMVTDAFTHKPIQDAVVTFDKDGKAIAVDSTGKFPLNCDGFPYYITVSFLGYETVHVKVDNCNHPLRVEMTPSPVELNAVQINGWANDEKNNQLYQAQSIGVLTQEDLNRGTGLGLVDAINMIPGVDMEYRTPFGGQHIIIRGYYGGGSGTSSLPSFNASGLGYELYINNIPITDATGTTLMDDIDFSTLGKVEVIKGPQSALYGSGIGGVVNMYTARPTPNSTEISQEAMGGSYGLWRTNTMLTTAGSNYDVSVDYGHQNYNGFRPNDASSKDYVTFTGNYYGAKQTLSTYFSYSDSYEQLAGEQDSAQFYSHSTDIVVPTYLTNNSHTLIESFRGGVTDDFKFSNHFSNETTLFATGHTENEPFAKGVDDYADFNFGARTGFVYDQNFNTVSVHGIVGGSVLKSDETMEGNTFGSASNERYTALTGTVFTQWNVNLPLQFRLTAGVSANFYSFTTQNFDSTNNLYRQTISGGDTTYTKTSVNSVYFGSPIYAKNFSPAVTPTVSLEKVFRHNYSVYANVSMGYTPPGIGSMLVTAPAPLGTYVDDTLKPERAIQYEIGTKGSLLGRKLSYQLALFYTNIYNKLVSEEAAAGYTFTANAGDQHDLGAELSVSYAIIENKDKPVSLLRPFISYSYYDFTYHNFSDYAQINAARQDAEVNFSGDHVAGVAPIRFNAGVDFALKYGVYLNLTDQYFDKTPYTFDNLHYVNAYNLLNAKIGYRHVFFHHLGLDVYAGVDNILGSTYYTEVFVGESIYQLGDGAILPAPYKPTFYGGGTLSYKF